MPEETLTAEEFARWMRASEASDLVGNSIGTAIGPNALMDRAAAGLMRVHAERGFRYSEGKSEEFSLYTRIPPFILRAISDWPDVWAQPFWRSNDIEIGFDGNARQGTPSSVYKFYEIRFEPAGVEKMVPGNAAASRARLDRPAGLRSSDNRSEAQAAAPLPTPSRAGRLSKDFWEDMVVAASRALWFEATLQPKTIAEVQRWMADWAVQNGHGDDAGDTALKERARKVFLAWEDSRK